MYKSIESNEFKRVLIVNYCWQVFYKYITQMLSSYLYISGDECIQTVLCGVVAPCYQHKVPQHHATQSGLVDYGASRVGSKELSLAKPRN